VKPAPLPTDANELFAIATRAQDGDKSAIPAVLELLKKPGAIDSLGGNLARNAMETLLGKYAGKNLLAREAITHKLDQMRAELAGPNPSPLETLLVERIVATWLHLSHLETLYAGKDSMSLELGSYFQKCISAASKRHLAAVKALAVIRRLAIPALQINVARKQVNVAGGVVAASTAN
jgi:hypothetical protein